MLKKGRHSAKSIIKNKILNNIEITEDKKNNITNEISEINKEEMFEEKDNGVLLISEIQNKVMLPYTVEEVKKILNDENNQYTTFSEVVKNVFIKPLSDYKNSYSSRIKETIKLLTIRDNYSKLDAISLALELVGQRYLNPAIISACKNLNELNVYLDCLDKNELDDFKVFEIKYELYPIMVDENSPLYKLKNLWKKLINTSEKIKIIMNFKKIFTN